ncbi:hypothetical protein KIL84_004864 [Mauremys mutica]|uniref:Ig-like domain-containing protein n=1 Tax=Mauremys mutica TaxID=74926 RepID=A0A9D4B0E0_9SAUR|nr:hypothetical protein KIL84_004864 [Mauremys mutica]
MKSDSRIWKNKRFFDDTGDADYTFDSPNIQFKIQVFLTNNGLLLSELGGLGERMAEVSNLFSPILCPPDKVDESSIEKFVDTLATVYPKDLQREDLKEELRIFYKIKEDSNLRVDGHITSALTRLNALFKKGLENVFLEICVCLHLLTVLPVSVASGECALNQATMTGKVPSFSPGSTVSSALPGYIALCLALQVHRLESAQFTVTGPGHPITVSLGEEAVLPCHLSPRMSAENMELRWFRSLFSAVVHRYKDGQDQYGEQMLEYQGRTELLKDNITSGSVSLRIHNVQLSDHGQYTCFFQSHVSYEEALLELQVAVSGSDPHISVDGHQDRGIRVVCRSAGWYPEPKAQWRDRHGQLLSSASEKISKEASGLFQSQISIVITEHSNQGLSCSIRNPLLNQEKISTVSIAELFFPRVNPWMVALGVILSLLAVLIALTTYCFWRQHREKAPRNLPFPSPHSVLLVPAPLSTPLLLCLPLPLLLLSPVPLSSPSISLSPLLPHPH